jgi:hypothetical protein
MEWVVELAVIWRGRDAETIEVGRLELRVVGLRKSA